MGGLAWPSMAQLVCMAAFLIAAKESVQCQTLKGLYMSDGRNWKSITTHEESPRVFLPEIAVPDELSVCVRYYIEFENGEGWLQIWTNNRPICPACPGIQLGLDFDRPKFWVLDAGDSADFSKGIGGFRENVIRKWNAMCWSFDFRGANETLQTSWNGEVNEAITAPGRQELPWGWNYDRTDPGVNFTLGKNWDGSYMIAKFVDFNAWNRRLSREEMAKYTDCKVYHRPAGNLVNGISAWLHKNQFIEDFVVSWDDVQCSARNNFTTAPIAEKQASFLAGNRTCNKLEKGGLQPELLTHDDYDHFYEEVRNHSAYEALVPQGEGECWDGGRLRYWLPYIEKNDASGFLHHTTGAELGLPYWVYWYTGPRLDRAPVVDSNRTAIMGYWALGGEYGKTFLPRGMSSNYCVACKIEHSYEKNTFLRLRGLCSSTFFDDTYVPRFKNGFIMYYGDKSTVIEYDPGMKTWSMYRSYDPTVHAESKATYGSLVIGNHKWTVSNDSKCSIETETKSIILSSCSSGQFTCDDGLCIRVSKRCDGANDCQDKSDEINCRKVNIDDSYTKHFSPPPYKMIDGVEKVSVNVSTTLLLIQGIFQPMPSCRPP